MEELSPKELDLTKTLAKKFEPVSLQGIHISIEPYISERDSQTLFDRSNGSSQILGQTKMGSYDADEQVWQFFIRGPFEKIDSFREFLNKLAEMPTQRIFTIFDKETNTQIGYFSMSNNLPEFLRVEIGYVTICPIAQNRGVVTEMVYLMLKHAFDIGYRRVEWKCNNLNIKSKIAAVATGFTFEFIQECHMVYKGKNRDTAWFRILKNEWEGVKAMLEKKINRIR